MEMRVGIALAATLLFGAVPNAASAQKVWRHAIIEAKSDAGFAMMAKARGFADAPQAITSLGSAIFAFQAVKAFDSIDTAQDALCPKFRVFEPDGKSAGIYDRLYPLYRKLYFGFGAQNSAAVEIGDVLPSIRKIAMEVRQNS